MDIAILTVVVAFWSLVQGAVLISRWNAQPIGRDLMWSGLGGITIGIGSGLFAVRYLEASYLLTSLAANVMLLSGLAFLVQGVRAADGLKMRPLLMLAPVMIWLLASSFVEFRESNLGGLWLFCSLALLLSLSAILQLLRGGLKLRGRQVMLGVWLLIAAAMASKIMDASSIVPGLTDRYAISVWHFVFLVLSATAVAAVGFVNLALSAAAGPIDAFLTEIEQNLKPVLAPVQSQISGEMNIWSLRIDRLGPAPTAGRAMFCSDAAARNMARVIIQFCPAVLLLQRLGLDRLVWVTAPATGRIADIQLSLLDHLQMVADEVSFSSMAYTCGVARIGHAELPAAAAAADKNAYLRNFAVV